MRAILRYLLIAGFFMILGFMYEYHIPKLKIWLIVQIEDFSTQDLPVRVLPGNISFSLWPPGIRVENVRLIPKGTLAKNLAPARVSAFTLRLRPQSVLSGDFRLSEILVENPEITIVTNDDSAPSAKPARPLRLKELFSIPIQNLIVENATVQIRSPQAEILGRIEDLRVEIENRNRSLYVEIDTEHLMIKRQQTLPPASTALLSFEGAVLLSEEEILIRGIKLRDADSFIISSGRIAGKIDDRNFHQMDVKARMHLELEDTLSTVASLVKNFTPPKVKGSFEGEFVYSKSDSEPEALTAEIETKQLSVEQFKIGTIRGKVRHAEHVLQTKDLTVENAAGRIHFQNATFDLEGNNQFKANVALDNLELRQFLINLDVGDTPLHMLLNSQAPCEGQLKPQFSARCSGKVLGSDFWIKNSTTGKTTVALEQFSLLDGEASVDLKAVTAKAKLHLPTSDGEASAVIDFSKGFNIKYSTPLLNFKDIKNLADLKIEGSAAIVGTTVGDSQSATFRFNLKGQNIWFEDYGLGNATGEIAYAADHLTFQDIEGQYNATQYFAAVDVDLHRDWIKATGRLGYAEARDIQNIFQRKVQLPFEFFGNAAATVSVQGPFQFNQLTYDLDAAVFHGSVATETFDEAKFHVTANKGEVKTQNVFIKKGLGVASLTGEGHPNGQIDTTIKGRGFRLEDLSLFNQADSSVTGNINFDMTLAGHVLSPLADIKGQVTESYLGKEAMPNSAFGLNISRAALAGNAHFLENKVWVDFVFPMDDKSPFKLKGKASKWNFAPLFGLLSKDVAVREFETELTADVDLFSAAGGFWKATGKATMPTLRIRRGNLELFNPQSATFLFENGRMSIKNFLLQGDNTFLKVDAQESRKEDFNVSMNGKIEMSLLAFLTPFFSDLRGVLSIAGQLDGNADQPKLIGSAFIDKGYAKLKELAHPFENIKADFLFNQQKIVVNSLQCVFAGGQATADGTVEIKGFRKFPTDLKGHFDKVNLAVPTDFATQGSGEFRVSGDWFPFTLAGVYNISSGTITRAFGEEGNATEGVKRSSFLPEFLLEKGFSPLKFDLMANFPSGLWVKNDMIESEIRGNLKIMGTPTDPVLLGEINTPPGGKIMFRDVPFDLTSASMKFTNPTKINPAMYASANTRIQEYDVNLLLQGSREDYKISLHSTPPLPEQDIITLLALGYTPQQLERAKTEDKNKIDQQINQQSSYEVGGAILSKNPLGSEIKNKYGVNVRFGSGVDDTTKTVAPKVIVSKQWSNKFGTSASRTVGNVVTQDVKAEYKLNKNVSVIGSWEGREYSEEVRTTESTTKNTDILGLDLQYRQEFK